MFCRKTFYSKIEKIHHTTLKVIYDIDDSYNNLLLHSNYVSIHQRHFRFLVTEIFKNLSEIKPEFMWSFFKQKQLSCNLRKGPILILLEFINFSYFCLPTVNKDLNKPLVAIIAVLLISWHSFNKLQTNIWNLNSLLIKRYQQW